MPGRMALSGVQWLTFNTDVGLLSEMAAVRRSITVQWTFCVQSLDGGLTFGRHLCFAVNFPFKTLPADS